MITQDDRTQDQVATHTLLVVGTDPGMSGWGGATGGTSFAAWACRPRDLIACAAWVRGRGDLKRVRVVGSDYRPNPRRCAHLHIYVWTDRSES